MKLTGERWANYSTKHVENAVKNNYKNNVLSTFSVGELRDEINDLIYNIERNGQDIYKTPFFLKYKDRLHVVDTAYSSYGENGVSCGVNVDDWDELKFTAPDSKPVVGEYWQSRGATDYDVAGFVKSKLAGERLRRLVRYVLDKDETLSWLDYREEEPNHIQFKFSPREFDIKKLDEMTEDTGIITEEILVKCKL